MLKQIVFILKISEFFIQNKYILKCRKNEESTKKIEKYALFIRF